VTIHAERAIPADLPAGLDMAADLAAQLHATLVRCAERDRPVPADPTAAALDRLLRQVANSADETFFQHQAASGRLVVALLSATRRADQLIRALDVGSNVVVLAFAEGEIVAFVPELPRRVGQDCRRARAHVVANELARYDCAAAVGVSSVVTAPHQLPAARLECLDAARLGARIGLRIVVADAHWAEIALARIAPTLPQCLTVENPVSRLVSYDAANGTPFAQTVHGWLQRNCDTAATAAALGVHPNTLRYRLRRASQLSGLDLEDAASRAIALLVLGVVASRSTGCGTAPA
jgi:sugar diacid utilization regulator